MKPINIDKNILDAATALWMPATIARAGVELLGNDGNKSGGNVGGATPTNKIITPFSDKIDAKLAVTKAPKLNPTLATTRQLFTDVNYLRGNMTDKAYYANTAFNANQVVGGNVAKTPLTYKAQNKQIDNLYRDVADKEQTTQDIVVNLVPTEFGGGYEQPAASIDWKLLGLLGGGALIAGLLLGGKR